MEGLQSLLKPVLERLSLQELVLAFGFVLGSLVIRKVAVHLLQRREDHPETGDGADLHLLLIRTVRKPLGLAILLSGLYLAVHSFRPSERVVQMADTGFWVLFSFVLTWLMFGFVDIITHLLHRWAAKTDTTLDDQLVPLVGRAGKVAVGILAALMILQNMGYSVSGLIAGLGVGGLALALAAQKTLADLFGSIMLLVDRPFVLGDWIRSPDGSIEGVVERIGFRSTRIRTFDRTLVTIPNSRLADFVIDNVTLRPARRVWMTVRVPHHATGEQVRAAVQRIEGLLTAHPEVDQDSFLLVRFVDFGEYSRDIMVYYFTKPTGWVDHLRIREEINFEIVRVLEDLGLSIAFPTQVVHLAQEDGGKGRASSSASESPASR